jgi:hypothetical protein
MSKPAREADVTTLGAAADDFAGSTVALADGNGDCRADLLFSGAGISDGGKV